MSFDRNKPYNDLPSLPPKADIETKAILKKAIFANRILAELKGMGEIIPNQSILVNSISLQEARLSSEIENVLTTNDKLYRALSTKLSHVDPQTKEVLHYKDALWQGYHKVTSKPILNTNLFIEICQTFKENTAGIRRLPGTKVATPAGTVIYTPPEGEQMIRDKLSNLEKYIHDEDDGVDPLIKLAVIHYQFEAIHPFPDGNGRTGRIVNILYLILHNLLDLPVLYMSKYIIENRNEYYLGLRRVTEKGEWEPWVLYMLRCVEETARYSRNRIDSIRELLDDTIQKVKTDLPKIYSRELVELLFENPYTRIEFLVRRGIASRNIASNYLRQLEGIGIVTGMKTGRQMFYLNGQLIDLLRK